jgi:hypothetical protein
MLSPLSEALLEDIARCQGLPMALTCFDAVYEPMDPIMDSVAFGDCLEELIASGYAALPWKLLGPGRDHHSLMKKAGTRLLVSKRGRTSPLAS